MPTDNAVALTSKERAELRRINRRAFTRKATYNELLRGLALKRKRDHNSKRAQP